MPSTAVLLLLLLLGTATANISSSQILGLDSYLTHQSRNDPRAINDSFLSLPSSLKKSLSSTLLPHNTIPSLISSLLSLSLPLTLHIRLLGPSFPPDSSSLLSSFLSAAHISDHFYLISPNPDGPPDHRLAVKHSLHLDVSHSPTLASRLSDAIKSAVSTATS